MRFTKTLTWLFLFGGSFAFSVVNATETLDTSKLISDAREIASELDDSDDRWRALVDVAGVEALYVDQKNGTSELVSLGMSAKYDFERPRVLKHLLELGAVEELKKLSERFGPMALKLTLQAEAGREYNKGFLIAAGQIDEPFERRLAFEIVGIMAARGGRIIDALEALNEVRQTAVYSSMGEVELLCEIANIWKKSDPERFSKIMDEAATVAKKVPRSTMKDRPRDRANSIIAQTWAAGGYDKQTFDAIRRIKSPIFHSWARLDASLAAARGGHPQLSEKLSDSVSSTIHEMTGQMNKLVSIQLALDDVDAALELVSKVSKSCDNQASAIANIARYMIAKGEFSEAMLIIDRIAVHSEPSVVSEKALLLEHLAKRQAEAGDYNLSKQTIDLIPRMAIENGKQIYECGVVRGQFVGVPQRNIETVMDATNKRIAHSAVKRAFGKLAEEMTANGSLDELSLWVKDVADSEVMLEVLLGIVRGQNTR